MIEPVDESSAPVLVLSQDYELFFQQSGTVENCLITPCGHLIDFAKEHRIPITFYVDAGMLCRMQHYSAAHADVRRDYDRVRRHIEDLANAGHEIGLHIHPHWEETRYVDSQWRFSGTRYQLRDFSETEVSDIADAYTNALNELCDGGVMSYRAGGFCVEPFDRLAPSLVRNGIHIDSSVVPGASLNDPGKGFSFVGAPDEPWWSFSTSPAEPDADGDFVEIPITPVRLGVMHYWGRLISRLRGSSGPGVYGDGISKAIGKSEILRRLMGAGRVSELSTDAAKADRLNHGQVRQVSRPVWHVMGHPKLIGPSSLDNLARFVSDRGIQRAETVGALGARVRQETAAR